MTPRSPRLLAVVAATALTAVSLTACSGGEDPVSKDRTPEEVFALAQDKLAEAQSVDVDLRTDDLPKDVDGLLAAEGTATKAPAFEGQITVQLNGLKPQVPVVAVDGKVWATLPFAKDWSEIDPAEYSAPDPTTLVDDTSGFGALLTKSEDVTEGESVRGGDDNSEVMTTYTASVPGDAVKTVMPSADPAKPFDAEYQVDSEGQLRELSLTGVFYAGKPRMTYTVEFDDYSDELEEIAAP